MFNIFYNNWFKLEKKVIIYLVSNKITLRNKKLVRTLCSSNLNSLKLCLFGANLRSNILYKFYSNNKIRWYSQVVRP